MTEFSAVPAYNPLLLWPIKRQVATADRIAKHKGRNPQECASLKKCLPRKWMSK
jgi:hypothetical protein